MKSVAGFSDYEWCKCSLCGIKIIKSFNEDGLIYFSCRNPRKTLDLKSSAFSRRYLNIKVFNSIRDFYIKEMNGSEELWREKVMKDVLFFNTVWRIALKSVISSVEINHYPPPENMRKIYLFKAASTVSRGCDD